MKSEPRPMVSGNQSESGSWDNVVGGSANGSEGTVENARDKQFHDSMMYLEEQEEEDTPQEEMKALELEEKTFKLKLQR